MQLSWHICSTGVWPARGKENVTTDGKKRRCPISPGSELGERQHRPPIGALLWNLLTNRNCVNAISSTGQNDRTPPARPHQRWRQDMDAFSPTSPDSSPVPPHRLPASVDTLVRTCSRAVKIQEPARPSHAACPLVQSALTPPRAQSPTGQTPD